ncbi:MAG: hypothetical protein L0Y72_21455 [Gemmataceae bacterium]|nr:hypothetical protein [Gemmataceae bacterium]MCI0741611.1 hypothetical protein [Gemmataceae bacterium]
MKLLTLTFLGLLVWSQYLVGDPLASQPLSMFRDGDFRPVGYALFALLTAIGALPLLSHYIAGRYGSAAVFALGLGFLLVVVATPSLNPLHEAASTLLLLLLFTYYAGALTAARSGWLFLHMAVPILLLPLLAWGYGPWQKGLIVYLLLVINIDWHVCGAWPSPFGKRRRSRALRRRVVYVVAPGKSWNRHKHIGGASYAT